MFRLSLGIICKNEKHNLPALFESIRDCVDAVFITDTGSTDGTRELLAEWEKGENPAHCPVFVSDFEWVSDFAAARNFNLAQLAGKSEHYMWLDADDSLVNPEGFREWRDKVMPLADQWLATYNYGDAGDGRNRCLFARERVFKLSHGFEWKYPIHEGVVPKDLAKPLRSLYAVSWSVLHRRKDVDAQADKARNISIFERMEAQGVKLDARMKFYKGKELFENRRPLDAFPVLVDAASDPETQLHDRVLAFQYACLAAAECGQIDRAIQLAHQALQLVPSRAEFHVILADSYMKTGRIHDAIPAYSAAKVCESTPANSPVQSPIFTHLDAYTFYPRLQLAKAFTQLGRFEQARAELAEAKKLGEHPEIEPLMAEVLRMQRALDAAGRTKPSGHIPTDEYVITCLPGGFYDWDDSSLETRGIGGSESAVVYLSRSLAKLGKSVRIFGNTKESKTYADGRIIYHPAQESADYLAKYLPKAHIAWRHATRLSPAPSYVWCHDLGVPGLDQHQNYDQVLALSRFHADWLALMCLVPREKIRIVSNAIDPELWEAARQDATLTAPRKPIAVWSSSPDRGLLTALSVMDEVVRELDEAELHVFYGFENMRTVGANAQADHILAECAKRPYVKVLGNLTKKELARHFMQSKAWLYPTNFLETYCITALEAYAAGLNIVARDFGALPERILGLPGKLIPGDPESPAVFSAWVDASLRALTEESSMLSLQMLPSWDQVAADWVTWLSGKQ